VKVLVVDDERDLVELIGFSLRRAGYQVVSAHDPATAASALESESPDLMVLDVNLGEHSGLDFLVELRQRNAIPVILLTGRDREQDIVEGLQMGADDYITKPFGHRELVARIEARLRRMPDGETRRERVAETLEAGPLSMNVREHTVTLNGQQLELTVTEFRLLRHLMANAGTVISTRTLLQQVWGYDDPAGSDVVRVAVYRLRRKLEAASNGEALLRTVSGVGVMLKVD
jgi:DNA-binding response OmpR family regulator